MRERKVSSLENVIKIFNKKGCDVMSIRTGIYVRVSTDDQKEIVWQLITDVLACNGKIPTESEINDFIWFNCDEIFFPEECDTE